MSLNTYGKICVTFVNVITNSSFKFDTKSSKLSPYSHSKGFVIFLTKVLLTRFFEFLPMVT